MPKKRNWIWEAYTILLLCLILDDTYGFFADKSLKRQYLTYLTAIDPVFFFQYFLDLVQIAVNALCFLPVAGYTYGRRIFSPSFWKIVFWIRIILEMAAHSYDLQFMKAIAHENTLAAGLTVLASLLLYLPSYVAHFLYAFGSHRRPSSSLTAKQ